MNINKHLLVKELIATCHLNLKAAEEFTTLSPAIVNYKPSPSSWSILECLEHLNRYSDFYLPEIEQHLQRHEPAAKDAFKPGFLGNYLVKMVIPGNSKKMKTFNEMDPTGSELSPEVLTLFIKNQHTLLEQLKKAEHYDLSRGAIPVTFTKMVQLKLGDTLRFMVYHNQRHIMQAQRNQV